MQTFPLGLTSEDVDIAYRLRGPVQHDMVAGDATDYRTMLALVRQRTSGPYAACGTYPLWRNWALESFANA